MDKISKVNITKSLIGLPLRLAALTKQAKARRDAIYRLYAKSNRVSGFEHYRLGLMMGSLIMENAGVKIPAVKKELIEIVRLTHRPRANYLFSRVEKRRPDDALQISG